jgi:hypothetical protein
MKTVITLAVVALLGIVFVGSVLGFRSDCVALEEKIKAQYDEDKNNYDNMWKKFREMAQVPSQYVEDMRKIWDSTMQGRYGAEGSKAALQFIQEHNPQLDPTLYTKLQSAIEAGRNSFEAEQKQLIDIRREYTTLLRSNRALFVNWALGFPKIDLDKYSIVTSDRTEDDFKKKKADEVDVFGKKREKE